MGPVPSRPSCWMQTEQIWLWVISFQSSTRDIEIITFQILSYEMPITVKQYFVTRQ